MLQNRSAHKSLLFYPREDLTKLLSFASYLTQNMRLLSEWRVIGLAKSNWGMRRNDWDRIGKRTILVCHANNILELPPPYLAITLWEWREIWDKYYIPYFGVKGRTVLDIGAGVGETAHFYFLNGAAKVIAVESEPTNCKILKSNAKRNAWNIEIHSRPFRLSDLLLSYDFFKMDIEGSERMLLRYKRKLKPCIIESHDSEVSEGLVAAFGLNTVCDHSNISKKMGSEKILSNCVASHH
jgi:hypothetical protein